jgi:hypothetical protein
MADYTIASSVNIEKGKQNEEYCVEQVISFQQQTNMEKVFDEVVYPEEPTLNKMDHGMWPFVALLSLYSDKTRHQTFLCGCGGCIFIIIDIIIFRVSMHGKGY